MEYLRQIIEPTESHRNGVEIISILIEVFEKEIGGSWACG